MIWSQKKYGLPAIPNYAALTGADVFDASQLRFNSTTSAGTVNADGEVTVWKSLINASKLFNKVDAKGLINIQLERNKRSYVISTTGAGLFRQASAAQSNTDFGYLWHHASGYSSMRWTIHCVCRIGCSDNYGSVMAFLANNQGGTPTQPGIVIYQGDRLAGTSDDKFVLQLSKSTSGYINSVATNSVLPSNTWQVVTIEFDGSLGSTASIKLSVDGVLKTIVNTSSSTTTVATGLHALEIFGYGNSAFTTITNKISHLLIQNVVETSGVRTTILSELQAWADYFNNDVYYTGETRKQVEEGRYYLGCKMAQDLVDDNKLFFCFTNGTTANAEAAKRLSVIKSTDYGKTWGAIATVHDPAGNEFIQSGACGVTPANKYVIIHDSHTYTGSPTAGAPHKLYYMYSTDQGATWSTPLDITSAIPSDGLVAFRIEGQVICNAGRIMLALYKNTDEGVTTNSANYLIYSDDDGATWGNFTVRASGTDYCNESAMLHLGGNNLYHLIGNYTDDDWDCYTSSDNGSTWAFQGLMGFTTSDTTPATLHKFKIDGVEIAAFYFYVHGSFKYKHAYAKVSELLANPLTAWPTNLNDFFINQFMMHGDFCHFNDSIDAVYCSPLQPDVFTGTVNTLAQGFAPTKQLELIIQELGL